LASTRREGIVNIFGYRQREANVSLVQFDSLKSAEAESEVNIFVQQQARRKSFVGNV
jgi:hypothetical protein